MTESYRAHVTHQGAIPLGPTTRGEKSAYVLGRLSHAAHSSVLPLSVLVPFPFGSIPRPYFHSPGR